MPNAEEIRRRILETVSKNGGHLASSLGAVELAIALCEEFDPENDRIIWDVGHQAYAWKILTGRDAEMANLRRLGGISGFPNPTESHCDAAIAGHAGVALSVADGYAAARRLTGAAYHVVAVTGDSSLVNGTSFEALNNCAAAGKVILVLNDNDMSISKPAGSFSRFLGSLIAGAKYNRVKNIARKVGKALHLDFLYNSAHWFKGRIKSLFLQDTFFEQFGFRYLGPVDGHDVDAIRAALSVAKDERRSVIVHVVTKKGKGFKPAEDDPTAWHGVGPFDLDKVIGKREEGKGKKGREKREKARGNMGKNSTPLTSSTSPITSSLSPTTSPSWSAAFGESIADAARKDGRIVALTAAMKDGTGLADFANEFPSSFFDVGIAEGHMVAFAAGLAAGGLRPVIAVYSTFLQRAIDHVMHDVCIAKLPVVFCVDRAGVVGADGVTHQGLYDIAMLRCLPNLTICQPKDADDLRALLDEALQRNGPTVIRYPRGKTPAISKNQAPKTKLQKPGTAIWATGDWLGKAQEVAEAVGGVAVHARYIKPFDAELLKKQRAAGMRIVSIENGCIAGGLGEAIGADMKFGWPDEFIPHGSPSELEKKYGLDVDSIVRKMRNEK